MSAPRGDRDDLAGRLLAADAVAPVPAPARPWTAADLDALLARRRRRAVLVGACAVLLLGAGAAWLAPRPRGTTGDALAALERQLRAVDAALDGVREGFARTPLPDAAELARWRRNEQAAILGAEAAAVLAGTDAEAARRQRDLVVRLWPDTAAVRALAAHTKAGATHEPDGDSR